MKKIRLLNLKFIVRYLLSKPHIKRYDELKTKKKCFVFLAADYGNLGDVAITYAQESFLKEKLPSYTVVSVPISKTLSDLKAVKKVCTKNDIITLVGGGNMSDLYFDIELLRQMVIKAFPHNKIYSFPQTLYFTNTPNGNYMLKITKKCYNKRKKNLTLIAREPVSYNKMKEYFSCEVKLLPDIVMTLDKRFPSFSRGGITFCLRNDEEKSLCSALANNLRSTLMNLGYKVHDYDTHIEKERLSVKEQEEELNNIWCQFKKSRWVVTDRLHGMVFCFITKTPCIVFPNANYKVEQCYLWIKDCGYIYFAKKDNDIDTWLSLMKTVPEDNFLNVHSIINTYFDKLFQ